MKGKEYFMDVRIRTATIEDAEELLGIYAYYIKNTAVTFEYEVPSVEEFQGRKSSLCNDHCRLQFPCETLHGHLQTEWEEETSLAGG